MDRMSLDNFPCKTIFLIFVLFISFTINCYSQSYGLGFSSYEVVQDKRTSLDLSPDKPLCLKGNFEISFELSFVPDLQTYFGYVLRIINDDNKNVDIIYDAQTKNHFNLIVGEKLSNIGFDIDSSKLYMLWNKVRIKFDFDDDKIILYSGNRSYTEKGVHLKRDGCYKILFGANTYNQFQTTDIPPMKLRNIKIIQNELVKYNWPLNEGKGIIAHEVIEQNDGSVINPLWMSSMHHDWHLAQSLMVNGSASIAFDAKNEMLYIVGADSLYSYGISKRIWNDKNYRNGRQNLNAGNESVFNNFNNSLYYIYPDVKFAARYNSITQLWDKKFSPAPLTKYWHFNKLVSKKDSSLYLFGGYGQLLYKNEVQQYHLNTNKWQDVATKGDFFTPRYLAALGSTIEGDTAYVIGGYGNESGKQILDPKNMYDVMRFTVKDKTFKKLFELNINDMGLAFANSLIIDSKAKTYYGLVFTQRKYNSNLQLISGSLTQPSYKFIGGSIPYLFNDVHSFADLYYCPKSNKFIAVTTLRYESGQTRVNIYTLLGPPLGAVDEKESVASGERWFLILLIIAVAVVVSSYTIYRRRRLLSKRNAGSKWSPPETAVPSQEQTAPPIPVFAGDEFPVNINQNKNSIYLFGDMQVFDAEGCDITKHFTPLIKELFLVILINSLKSGIGLSSEKLNEILWYDKSAKSARNNRSVNITKLKMLLDKLGYCHLSKDTGYWKIDIDFNHIYVDYHTYLNIIKNKKQLDIEKIQLLIDIVKRGNFLSNVEYEWLDTFKSEVSNDIIDNSLHFIHSGTHLHDQELLIDIVNFIFYFDPVNEEAMIIKCKALSTLGKHSLAKHTFETFNKEYKNLYGEEFKKDFHAITE